MNLWLVVALPAAAAVVCVLAGLLIHRGWQQRRHRRQCAAERQQQVAARQAHLTDSASRLADAMLNHDLNLSEGAIRLKVMLDHLLPESERAAFAAIYRHDEQVAGFARRDARRQLNGMQRLIQDAEREALEQQNRDAVLAAAEQVIARFGAPQIGR